MNRLKKIILSAILLTGGLCAMNAQEKTTTADVPLIRLNNGVEMPRFGLGTFHASDWVPFCKAPMKYVSNRVSPLCVQDIATLTRHMLTTMKKVWVRPSRKAAFHAKKFG